jgi:acyl-CoA synthetase (NDP forming)
MHPPPIPHSPVQFWDALFSPASIAVIGANDTIGSWGSDAIKAAIAFTEAAPGRRAYAVNPNQQQVLGTPAYKTVSDIPGPVDLAIVVVRAVLVPEVMRQCVAKGVRAVVVISAGFAETDAAGVQLEAEVVAMARQGGIRMVGPNCIGHADLYSRVSALGVAGRAPAGPLALLSQSGTVSASIMGAVAGMGIGLSKFVSTGNEADLHLEDYLEFLAGDPQTRLVAGYVEGLREGRRFLDIAKRMTATKPIVLIKAGGTEGAGKAARSHTGALAGSDVVYAAAFRQAGVIRVNDEEELADVALALLTQPRPRGNRVGILTIGGGFGVLTAEACEREGLAIAPLQPATLARLDEVLPSRWSHGNPVDMVGVKAMGEFPTILACLRALVDDDNLDAVVALVANRGYAGDGFKATMAESERALRDIGVVARQKGRPLFLVRRAMSQWPDQGEGPVVELEERLAEYPTPRRVARAMGHLVRYGRWGGGVRSTKH